MTYQFFSRVRFDSSRLVLVSCLFMHAGLYIYTYGCEWIVDGCVCPCDDIELVDIFRKYLLLIILFFFYYCACLFIFVALLNRRHILLYLILNRFISSFTHKDSSLCDLKYIIREKLTFYVVVVISIIIIYFTVKKIRLIKRSCEEIKWPNKFFIYFLIAVSSIHVFCWLFVFLIFVCSKPL